MNLGASHVGFTCGGFDFTGSSRSTPKNCHSTPNFARSLDIASVIFTRMLSFRMLPRPTLAIRADLPPLGPSRTPTDTCIPFVFNTPVTYRSRRCSTGSLLSPFLSLRCGLFLLQRTGTPPSLDFISRSVAQSALCERTIARFCALTPLPVTHLRISWGEGGHRLSYRVLSSLSTAANCRFDPVRLLSPRFRLPLRHPPVWPRPSTFVLFQRETFLYPEFYCRPPCSRLHLSFKQEVSP
jgi:hypothetical protein